MAARHRLYPLAERRQRRAAGVGDGVEVTPGDATEQPGAEVRHDADVVDGRDAAAVFGVVLVVAIVVAGVVRPVAGRATAVAVIDVQPTRDVIEETSAALARLRLDRRHLDLHQRRGAVRDDAGA